MSGFEKIKKYAKYALGIDLLFMELDEEMKADTKRKNYILANNLRQKFCGSSITEEEFKKAFFNMTDDPEYLTRSQKTKWPTIIFARNAKNLTEYLGFIVYQTDLTKSDLKQIQAKLRKAESDKDIMESKPAKIVAICTVGGNQCVGQSLLAAALAEENISLSWIVDIPPNLQSNGKLVSRFFNHFDFTNVATSGDRMFLMADTSSVTTDDLLDILQNCKQADVADPQLSVQAAVEVKEVKEAVAQGVQAALGVDQKQAEAIAVAAVANAVSVNPSVPVTVPAEVQTLADEAMAEVTNGLISVALDDEKDASDGSSRQAVQALVKQVVAEAVLEPRSKLSRNQKIAALGVLAGGLVGLGGILRLVANKTKTKTIPPSRRKNRRS